MHGTAVGLDESAVARPTIAAASRPVTDPLASIAIVEGALVAAVDLEDFVADASIPAAVAHGLLGMVDDILDALVGTLLHVPAAINRSLSEYEPTEDDGRDPTRSIEQAAEHLFRASSAALDMRDPVRRARAAIALQGYRRADAAP